MEGKAGVCDWPTAGHATSNRDAAALAHTLRFAGAEKPRSSDRANTLVAEAPDALGGDCVIGDRNQTPAGCALDESCLGGSWTE